MRLVLVSFAVLALVFYEMSGGADFKPPEAPQTAGNSALPKAEPTSRQVATLSAAKPLRTKPATLVAKPAPKEETLAAKPEPREPSAELKQVRASLSQGLTLVSGGAQGSDLSLASLELGASGLRPLDAEPAPDDADEQLATPAPQDADLREIIGTRVNMRDGPGTIYPVIARLSIGQTVEVLSESGTGWLRLRTMPDRRLGWISASLVSKPGG